MGKTILITGASSGFGRLTAETLSRSGHKVFAGFRSTDGSKRQVADALEAQNIEVLEFDVTDHVSVMVAVGRLLETSRQKLDVVIKGLRGIVWVKIQILSPQHASRWPLARLRPLLRPRDNGTMLECPP